MSEQTPNSVDPRVNLARQRTGMASYRTQLALDRTTLAWVRTALTMASFGFGMVAFFRSMLDQSRSSDAVRLHRGAIRMGTALLILGIVGAVLAGVSHWLTLRRLRRGESPGLSQWPLSVTVAMLIAVIGLVGLWELFAR
jgi:putative membrane protein